MTIHKKTSGKSKGSSKEVATTSSSSSDMTTVETVEMVSSTSMVEEATQIMESESRSSVVEVTSASREVIMDSKGNVIKVIESAPQTVGQSTSTYRTGKSSQDFIAQEQMQSVKQGKTVRDSPQNVKDVEVRSDGHRGETLEQVSRSSESRSESRAETIQKSISSSMVVETSSSMGDYYDQLSKTTSSNGIVNGDHAPRIHTSSKSYESKQASKETYEETTKDGKTFANISRIHESGEKLDDNGRVTATQSRIIDKETTVVPSDVGRVKHTDDVRIASNKVILDSSSNATVSESTAKSSVKADKISDVVTRCNKPGQSTWDGTFISESPAKDKDVSRNVDTSRTDRDSLDKAKIDRLVSKVNTDNVQESMSSIEISESSFIDQRSSSTVIQDSKIIIDEGRSSSTNIESFDRNVNSIGRDIHEHVSEDTIDFAGGQRQVTTEAHSKGSTRYTKPGESTWDGTFMVEKTPEPRKRNVSDASVFHHTGGDNVIESTQRTDFKEKSSDGSYEKKSSNVVHVVQGGTDSSRFISEERKDVTEEIYIDGKPVSKTELLRDRSSSSRGEKITRPGDSTWNGQFVYEKLQDGGKKLSSDKTVVRTSAKRHDSVDVQDVTEEQNISSMSESVSSSYVVEYATSTDEKKKTSEKVTSVSEIIIEEDSGDGGSPRRSTPEKSVTRDTTSRCYKPGQSTWDGSFVYEKPQVHERRKLDSRRPTDSIVIRDVTEDNSINEAEISSTAYVVEHSSSQQSFTDVKDSSLSSVHETIVYDVQPVRQDRPSSRTSSRPETPDKTPKGRDTRLTKPGSSTWDGTFVMEKSPETKRPSSRESVDRPADKIRPEPRESPIPKSRKHISDTTLDIRDTSQQVSTSSEVYSNSIVLEQSTTHESYTDSSNVDYSTSSVETVIVRNGVPTTIQKSVTIEDRSKSPEKKALEHKGLQPEDSKSPDKRPKSPSKTDSSFRPSKPGASTWDGSFVYEKPAKKPTDKKPSTDVSRRPTDERAPIRTSPVDNGKLSEDKKPTYLTEKSITLSDTTMETSEFVTSTMLERTLASDSEVLNSSKVSTTIFHEIDDKKRTADTERELRREVPRSPSGKHPEDGRKSPERRPKSPEKSPVDRSMRPTKPGASTWDGSFVYEKPQDQKKKPTDQQKEPVDEKKRPRESPTRDEPKDRPSSVVPKDDTTKISVVKHDVTDTRKDVMDIDIVQKSSYVIDQSSFTSVQDVRNVLEERVISEFTTDTRKDVVSNDV